MMPSLLITIITLLLDGDYQSYAKFSERLKERERKKERERERERERDRETLKGKESG